MADVRPATASDEHAVVALLAAQLREHAIATDEAALARMIRATLARPNRGRILVACDGQAPIGVAALAFGWPLEHGDRATWLEELYVAPAHRGRGIGTALLEAACRVAAENGAVAVDLEVDAGHARAARLYARHGFQTLPRTRWVRRLTPAWPPAQSMRARWDGGCFCRALRYRVDASPQSIVHCHCTICRRTSGAPFVTWATFPAAALTFTGEPAELRATARALRTFCRACGTPLTFRADATPDSVDVTVASLDAADEVVPEEHIWTADALRWLQVDDALPRFVGERKP